MSDLERRFTPVPVELRVSNNRRRIGGYAAVFNSSSRNLGGFVEQVAPGFFNDSRSRGWPDVVARYNHDDNMVLGTTGSGTLSLALDSTGLLYDVDPPAGRADVLELVERGDIRTSSFAFRTLEDEWTQTDQGFPQRTLITGILMDVAPVVSAAYPDTTAGLRSLAKCMNAPIEDVKALAKENELRKFFERTDGKPNVKPQPKLTLVDARALLTKHL